MEKHKKLKDLGSIRKKYGLQRIESASAAFEQLDMED